MKLRNVLLTLGLATTVAAGAMAFGLNNASTQAMESNAGTGSAANTMTIFIGANGEAKCDINGGDDAANVGIYLFTDGVGDSFLDAQRIGDNYFSAVVPTTYEKMILVRTNPNKSFASDGWDAKYNQSANIDFSSSNLAYTLTGIDNGTLTYSASTTLNTSKTNYINEGTRYYFDAYNLRDWWHNNSDTYHTYVATYTDFSGWYGAWAQWFEMTRIPNIDIYYVDIPYGVCANGFDIVRNSSASYTGCNQTWSVTGLTDLSYISVYSSTDQNKYQFGYSVCNNDEMLYSTYRSYFLAMDLCYDAGGLKDGAAALWVKAEETYDVMYDLLISKTYIKTATADFIDRYDAVVSKNEGYDDFMERGISYVSPNGIASSIMMNTDSNASIMIVVIASSVALLSAASFFMIRRRKEQ